MRINGFYWIYLIMLGVTLWYHFTENSEKKRLIYWGTVSFLLLLFVVQDSSVSVDMKEYMLQYDIIQTLSFGQMLTHKFEIGYVLICRILGLLFSGKRVLLLVVGMIMIIPFARSFETDTKQPMIALLAFLALGMYQHALIYWRQMMAMAIMAMGYRFIKEQRFWWFLLFVLVAMTFHKMSVFFLVVYFLYTLPINHWMILGAAVLAVIGGVFCEPLMSFILTYLFEYHPMYHIRDGGETLLVVLWFVVLLAYWVLKDQMNDENIKLHFIMVLIAAALQPVCFAFYNWLRVVLFFRIALVPLCVDLYIALFCRTDGNRVLSLAKVHAPKLYDSVLSVYDAKWFLPVCQIAMFTILFGWYLSELDGAVYVMANIG